FLKDDNRAAARRICDVIGQIGLYVVPADKVPSAAAEAEAAEAIEQNIELLAEAEHDGWVEARLRNEWTRAGGRNWDRREHPDLVPWHELADDRKERDRAAVRRYREIVARADYRIVTGPAPRPPGALPGAGGYFAARPRTQPAR